MMRKRKRIQYLDRVEQLKPAALLKDEKLVHDRKKNKLTKSQCSREHNNKTSKMFYDAHTDRYEGY